MQLYDECRDCLYNSQLKKVTDLHGECHKLQSFKEGVRALCDGAPDSWCAPLLMQAIDGVHRSVFGGSIDYSREKHAFNTSLLRLENVIWQNIVNARYPIMEGIKFAMAANYIDYARLDDLNEQAVSQVFAAAARSVVEPQLYNLFISDLSTAKTLVYLHDNCGEIVLDKLLIRAIKRAYPRINVISVVRGGAIINDVTREDAEEVGLGKYSYVVDSGAAIPGTYLPQTNALTRSFIQNADVVISKGLGNFETLFGSLNGAYYMFMCKCRHIAQRFGKELWETAFVTD